MEDTLLDEATLRAAGCWESVDRVPGDEATTAFKRHARWHQATWRERQGHPIGSHPYRAARGEPSRPVASRLEHDFAVASGANLLTEAARQAARERLATPEKHQTLRSDRLWADLLSSMPLCFNLFGDLAADPELASRCVRAWWPEAPQGDVRVRFEWSPARLDLSFLGNRSAFDAAFEVTTGPDTVGVIGVETKYHEHAVVEVKPSDGRLARYGEVSERSGVFRDGWRQAILGTPLQQIWLDHLLCLSMLQHPSKRWTWGRFVLVFPRRNPSFTDAAKRYQALLRDATTFEARTIEELLETPGCLPAATVAALRDRYLW